MNYSSLLDKLLGDPEMCQAVEFAKLYVTKYSHGTSHHISYTAIYELAEVLLYEPRKGGTTPRFTSEEAALAYVRTRFADSGVSGKDAARVYSEVLLAVEHSKKGLTANRLYYVIAFLFGVLINPLEKVAFTRHETTLLTNSLNAIEAALTRHGYADIQQTVDVMAFAYYYAKQLWNPRPAHGTPGHLSLMVIAELVGVVGARLQAEPANILATYEDRMVYLEDALSCAGIEPHLISRMLYEISLAIDYVETFNHGVPNHTYSHVINRLYLLLA